jgi:hypothetical protein
MPDLSTGLKSDTMQDWQSILLALNNSFLFLNLIYTQNKDKNDTLAGFR